MKLGADIITPQTKTNPSHLDWIARVPDYRFFRYTNAQWQRYCFVKIFFIFSEMAVDEWVATLISQAAHAHARTCITRWTQFLHFRNQIRLFWFFSSVSSFFCRFVHALNLGSFFLCRWSEAIHRYIFACVSQSPTQYHCTRFRPFLCVILYVLTFSLLLTDAKWVSDT